MIVPRTVTVPPSEAVSTFPAREAFVVPLETMLHPTALFVA
jgi:hypothetical protein